MSQAAFNVFDALSAWGKTLSNWQRCLLVKLVGAVDFPDEALDEVYREYLMDQQLAPAEMPRATWDIALPQIQGGPTTAASVVTAMTALTGVNALAPGEQGRHPVQRTGIQIGKAQLPRHPSSHGSLARGRRPIHGNDRNQHTFGPTH